MSGSGPAGTESPVAGATRLAAEQAALRRVATLVAQQTSEAEIFTAVAEELGSVLGVEDIRMVRFDEGEKQPFATVVASWGTFEDVIRNGERYPLGGRNVTSAVFGTGHSARCDDYSTANGVIGDRVRDHGVGSAVGVPVTVEGRLWGAMLASAVKGGPLPPDTEPRLGQFTELMGAAIANAESRTEVDRLADEQAALRRVATMVAEGPPAALLFAKVAEEVASLLGRRIDSAILRYEPDETAKVVAVWGEEPHGGIRVGARLSVDGSGVAARVLAEKGPVRVDGYAGASGEIAQHAKAHGIRSAVGCPILVQGVLWGAMVVAHYEDEPFPRDTERRVAQFTELIATAISNTEARSEVQRLADEQAALRRVATLVAKGAAPSSIFDAVIAEVQTLLEAAQVGLVRFEGANEAELLAQNKELTDVLEIGMRVPLDGDSATARVRRTGRAARIDLREDGDGAIVEAARRHGITTGVAAPITVEGATWGAIAASWKREQPPPAGVEQRLAKFAQLLDTAISNTEARSEVQRLADEQAALRRVATLVAKRADPAETFDAVIAEAGKLLGAEQVGLARYEGSGEITILAMRGDGSRALGAGIRMPIDGDNLTVRVLESESPARINLVDEGEGQIAELARRSGVNATVGAPIRVEGRLWGVIAASWKDDSVPAAGAERRLAGFAELLDTAIAEAAARAQLQRLAREQAAFRRVATLVAEGAIPAEVFEAVIVEVAELLDAAQVGLMRSEDRDEVTILAHLGQPPGVVYPGMRLSLDGDSVTRRVLKSGRSARLNLYDGEEGPIVSIATDNDVNVTVGAPVTVEGALWGVITASWRGEDDAPPDAEERLAEFAALLDTAIGNADSRDQLTASRARVLSAGDEARRRVVRDLHDGAQQRLVHTIVSLQLAQRALGDDDERAGSLLGEALDHARQGNSELRELAHGILPSVLTRGGLRAAVEALVSRLDLPVEQEVTGERLALDLEASAYFIVAEALTNVVKHSKAARAEVSAELGAGVLRVEVRDDGVGGATAKGHGLLGIGDRVAALDGRLSVDSPPGVGTLIVAELPLSARIS